MLEYKLENGKTIKLKGNKFEVDVLNNGDLVITVVNNYMVSPSQTMNDLFDETPQYLKKDTHIKERVVKLSDVEKATSDHDEITEIGKKVFFKFMKTWNTGFGDKNAEQPDRAKLLNDTMSDYSLHVIRYVKSVGGLTHATMHVFPTDDYSTKEYRTQVRLLAENVSQVASILCPPLSELLEYPFLLNTTHH